MTINIREGRHGREAGVTVLEMMVTVTVAAVLMALSIPGLADFARNAKRDSLVSELLAALNLARAEAVKRSHPVTLCPSANGRNCNGDNRWETGWIVFADPNGNGDADSAELILLIREKVGGDGTVRSNATRRHVTYQGSGFSVGNNTTLRVCDPRGTGFARRVIVSNNGRARVKTQADACP